MDLSRTAQFKLTAPDGYYAYLNVPKPSSSASPQESDAGSGESPLLHSSGSIEAELVKKQYRLLSKKHHPDRSTGDAATFRLLNRAQKVLLNPKLRRQYDILGIDLDEDEDDTGDDGGGDDDKSSDGGGKPHSSGPKPAQGIIQEMASVVLMFLFYLVGRTALLGAFSVIVSKFRVTLYPAQAFFAFNAYRSFQRTREPGYSTWDIASPILISAGLWAMHLGRIPDNSPGASRNGSMTSWWFWFGEALLIGIFACHSAPILSKTPLGILAISLCSSLAALYLRGSLWNYVTALVFQLALAFSVGMAFPFVEKILEIVLEDKLRRVGERVRAHHLIVESYYRHKLESRKTPPASIQGK